MKMPQNAGTLGAGIALATAIVFAIAASAASPVARYGGAVWVFILAWIILMPILAPKLNDHRQT